MRRTDIVKLAPISKSDLHVESLQSPPKLQYSSQKQKKSPKTHMESQRTLKSQRNLSRKSNAESVIHSTWCPSTPCMSLWWHLQPLIQADTVILEENGVPEINPCSYSHLLWGKWTKSTIRDMLASSTNAVGKWILTCRWMKCDPHSLSEQKPSQNQLSVLM